MSNPYRDALLALYTWANSPLRRYQRTADVMHRTRVLLTQPHLLELTDEDLISAHDLAAEWNQQADADNQWDSLDLYEQLAWAQFRSIAADRARR